MISKRRRATKAWNEVLAAKAYKQRTGLWAYTTPATTRAMELAKASPQEQARAALRAWNYDYNGWFRWGSRPT